MLYDFYLPLHALEQRGVLGNCRAFFDSVCESVICAGALVALHVPLQRPLPRDARGLRLTAVAAPGIPSSLRCPSGSNARDEEKH